MTTSGSNSPQLIASSELTDDLNVATTAAITAAATINNSSNSYPTSSVRQFGFSLSSASAFNFTAFRPPETAFSFASHFINSAAVAAAAVSVSTNTQINCHQHNHHHHHPSHRGINHHQSHPYEQHHHSFSGQTFCDNIGVDNNSFIPISDSNNSSNTVNCMQHNNLNSINVNSTTSASKSLIISQNSNHKTNKDNLLNFNNYEYNNKSNNNNNDDCKNNDNNNQHEIITSEHHLNGYNSQDDQISSHHHHLRNTESPDTESNQNINQRFIDNSSPVDSTRSFSVSQRSVEEICGKFSPTSVESVGSRSPEIHLNKYDYSSPSIASSSISSTLVPTKILPDMLDHKLPLSFLGPPLAALHSMAEMKSPSNGSPLMNNNSNSIGISSGLGTNTSIGLGQTSVHNLHGTANPHGIDTILSRPPPVTSAGLSALTAGGMPRFSIAAAAAGMAQYLSQSQNASLKAHSGHLVDRPHLYWPGLQGLVANPMAWRERLSNTMTANLAQSHCNSSDKDNKKKHTRPTFSGQQIFALEKTFEQTKYLAGPERAKLAYALGMTESQVKVWFQNRRTKWRKKHAAEMATAKRKQEELGDNDGDCSEALDSDSESLDLVEQRQKRC